jgi:Spy/CpxP family protein refolding chaperone
MGGPPLPIRELNLSEAQQQQVRVIRQQHQAALREAEARVRAAAQAQQSAVQTAPVNEGLNRSTSQAVADAETDLAIEQARIYSETWFVLSPQQQEQLTSLRAQRQSARDGRPERRARRNQGAPAKP